MTDESGAPERLWAVGCNVAFNRTDDGDFVIDPSFSPINEWLQHLVRSGLLAPEHSFDFTEAADGTALLLIPVDAEVDVSPFPDSEEESDDPGGATRIAPAAVAGGILIGMAGNAAYEAVKAGVKAVVTGPVKPGIYNHPSNPRPPIRPGGGPHIAI